MKGGFLPQRPRVLHRLNKRLRFGKEENELIRRITVNALIACITVLLTLTALEAAVRLGGETDADGQFNFMGYTLHPYAAPVERQRRVLEAYIENQSQTIYDQTIYIYDEMLGWSFRPNATIDTTVIWHPFTINSAGLRSQREYSQRPPPDTLRIALFGDSFTAGDEVSDDETWGHQLETKLNQAGIRTEVLNFGVNAYGMDQAFLRWQEIGRGYAPDMVIFGFQPENLDRNVNIFPFASYSYRPFSKPRFILTESAGLELLNSPTMPPEQIADVFESFASHPLAQYEYHYQKRDTAPRLWPSSRLVSYLHEALKRPEDDEDSQDAGPANERGLLGKAIVDAFATDVKESGAAFFALYLPRRVEVQRLHDGTPQSHQFLLDHLDEAYHYITFEDQLDRFYLNHGWARHGHYGPEIASIAARAAADEIQSCIESGACELSRFEDKRAIFTSE